MLDPCCFSQISRKPWVPVQTLSYKKLIWIKLWMKVKLFICFSPIKSYGDMEGVKTFSISSLRNYFLSVDTVGFNYDEK